ncbi:MAG: hypothetical protein IT445_09400 [Phycisphaeraceae bacterium]|nr:hypothetical protein [Phycisphaeraceae bacterium]
MSEQEKTSRPRRSLRRRLRWIVRALLVLLLAVAALAWWMTRPEHLRRLVLAGIQQASDAQVSLGAARFDWREGTLYLHNLQIGSPGIEHGQVFEVQQVLIDPSWWSLLFGSVRADELTLVGATLYLTEDRATGRYLFEPLLSGSHTQDNGITHPPQVTVRSGQIVFREIEENGQLTQLAELAVVGRLWQERQAGPFQFMLRRSGGDEAAPPTLRGRLNLEDPSVWATLDGFRFEQPQRYFLRHELRAWWDRMQPQGAFDTIEVGYEAQAGWQAKLALRDASLNVPLGEYAPRMTQVSGQLRVLGHAVVLDSLRGEVEGLRYRVSGRVWDVREKESARFALSAATDWFTIDPPPEVIPTLPGGVGKYYDRFQPTGEFRLQLVCGRQQAGGPIGYQGRVALRHVSGRYYKFPYPCHDVEGLVRFDSRAVEIEQLRGRGRDGMTFELLDGRISPPGDGAEVRMKLRCRNLPVDEVLLAAMKDKHRAVVAEFFDRPSLDRLQQEAGPFSQRIPVAIGKVRQAVIDIHRPRGAHARTQVTSQIDVAGLNVLYRHWPYPMTADAGLLTIRPGDVAVDVRLSGINGARGRVSGVLQRDAQDRLSPKLRIEDALVPIDELLIATLPQPQNQWLRDLHAQGALAGEGDVWRQDDGQVNFKLASQLLDGRAAPYGGTFAIQQLAGRLTIERHKLQIEQLTGEHDSGRLSIGGAADWSHQPLSLDLTFAAEDLPLDRQVLDLLPPQRPQRNALEQLFERYQISGQMDAALHYASVGPAGHETYRLELTPRQLGMQLATGPVSFERMSGRVIVEPGLVALEQLSSSFDAAARLSVNGTVTLGEQGGYDLALEGDSLGVGPTLGALLPRPVRRSIDALQLDGTLVLEKATWRGDGDDWQFDGDLSLINAGAEVGVPITQLDGRLGISASQTVTDPLPRVKLDLQAHSLLAAQRLIQPLNVRVRSAEDGRQLVVEEFLGSIYGGTLMGQGAIELGADNRFRFKLVLQDVALEPFLHPADPRAQGGGGLTASLTVESKVSDPASRVGRGALEVHDANLYNQPIPLAMLQALNLALPMERSFDQASARYLVLGDTVLFDSLRFEAPGLVLSGAGSMDYPTQSLNLEMVTRNPTMPDLGAVGEVINKLKDEVITIRLSGTLAQPQARAVALSGILRSWDQLFQAKAAGIWRRSVEPGW